MWASCKARPQILTKRTSSCPRKIPRATLLNHLPLPPLPPKSLKPTFDLTLPLSPPAIPLPPSCCHSGHREQSRETTRGYTPNHFPHHRPVAQSPLPPKASLSRLRRCLLDRPGLQPRHYSRPQMRALAPGIRPTRSASTTNCFRSLQHPTDPRLLAIISSPATNPAKPNQAQLP